MNRTVIAILVASAALLILETLILDVIAEAWSDDEVPGVGAAIVTVALVGVFLVAARAVIQLAKGASK